MSLSIRPQWLPTVSLVVMFGVLVVQSSRHRSASLALRTQADSTLKALGALAARRDSLIEAGQLVPAIPVVNAGVGAASLRDLAVKYRLIYLRSDKCAGCAVLDAALGTSKSTRLGEIATVSYLDMSEAAPASGMALYRDPSGFQPWPLWGVPTVLAVNSEGRVVSAAHANLNRARDVMAMNGMLEPETVDSIRIVRESASRLIVGR